jgi:tyrosine-protein phosphatase SIW14
MRRPPSLLFGSLIALLVVGGPLGYRLYEHRTFRNFRTVRPGVLYRSGQLSRDGLMRLIHDRGIRTVISLRDATEVGHRPPDWAEEEFCLKEELYYFRLSPKLWWATEGPAPAAENVREFLEILDNPKYQPVLVHCFAGTHRTGAYCAIYRMEYEHWSNADAMQELFVAGYDNLFQEDDVSGFLENYVPRWARAGSEEASEPRK